MLLQKWSPQCWVEGKDHLPRPTGNAPPNAALCAAKLHCCLVVIITLRTFSAGLLFSQAITSLTEACGYALPLLNFNRSSSAHQTNMSRSFQMVWHTICGVDPPGTSATPPAFYLPQTCSRCTVWLSRSLMKSKLDWPQSVLPSSYTTTEWSKAFYYSKWLTLSLCASASLRPLLVSIVNQRCSECRPCCMELLETVITWRHLPENPNFCLTMLL